MIEIRPLDDRGELSRLLARQPLEPFLQSWAWGEFQAAVGRRIWRLGAYDGATLVGAALGIEHQLVLGKTYLYCPRGPVAASTETFSALLDGLRQLGEQAGAMYVKVDPNISSGWEVTPPSAWSIGTPLQPRVTQVLDLGASPDAMMKGMHPKTRYNIRLAEKKGVTTRWSTDDADFRTFLMLITATYGRQGIRLHPQRYYQTLWRTLKVAGMIELGMAELDGRALAANLVIWHGQAATYLHGGSSDHEKNVMAPHLLQWATIQRAIERGVKAYDFWGVAPNDLPTHAWAGVTRFKKGFGGRTIAFPPALNTVLQPVWYQAYRLAKRMRGGVDA